MSLRSGDEIQEALRSFMGRWGNYAGTERSEAQTFLNELFAAYGADRKEVARFEDPQGSGGIVDCLYPGVAIIEMKRPGEADRLAGHRVQALEYWHHSDDPAAGLARRASSCSARSNVSRSGNPGGSPRHRSTASTSPSCQIATRRSTS